MGMKPTMIAGLGRSASTLSRELHRNSWSHPKTALRPRRPSMADGYRAEAAHQRAHVCPVKPRVEKRLHPGAALWEHVVDYLKAGYSPEQVAGTLVSVHSDTPSLQVSHGTLYTAIYAMPRGALRTEVIGGLRFGHAKRRPRARGEDRRGKIWSASMTGHRRLRNAWCPDTGRVISSRARTTVLRWAHWWSDDTVHGTGEDGTRPAPNPP